jgi:hypothetical protein
MNYKEHHEHHRKLHSAYKKADSGKAVKAFVDKYAKKEL